MTDEAKTEQEAAIEAAELKAKEDNDTRTGKGTRLKVGQTRGRNPQVVSFEAFDESLKDTLPDSIAEFIDLLKIKDEAVAVSYLIDGFNSASYANASDPVNAYIDSTWSPEVQKGFKLVVKNYSANLGVSIEDAAGIIKPAYVASQAKKA